MQASTSLKNGMLFQIGLLENTCLDQCSEIVSGNCNLGPPG